MEDANQNSRRKQRNDETGTPVQLSEEQLAALAHHVGKSLKARELRIIASKLASSLKPKDFLLIGRTLGKSPLFLIIVVIGMASACLTIWEALPHFVKEKADALFNQEMTNQIHLQFQEPRISNIVVAVARDYASEMMTNLVSPEIAKFERSVREQVSEIYTIQTNLNNIQTSAETNLVQLNAIADLSQLIVAAQSGSRADFWRLYEIGHDTTNSMHELALKALVDIANKMLLNGMLIDQAAPQLAAQYWLETTNKPETASLQEYQRILLSLPQASLTKIALIRQFYEQTRFPVSERLAVVYWFLKYFNDIQVVNQSCILMDKEAHLGKNYMAQPEYAAWYENWVITNKAKAYPVTPLKQ